MGNLHRSLIIMALIFTTACIITGEARVLPEAGPRMAQTVKNRIDAGRGLDGWHAIASTPDDWALKIAAEVWLNGINSDGDIFALSLDDMARLGFDINSPDWT